jgi:hypothetical protein
MGLAEVAAYRLVVLFKGMTLTQNSQRHYKAEKENTYAASGPWQENTWLLVPMRHPSNKKVGDEHTTGWRHTRRIGHMLHIWRHICSRRAWRRHPRHHWLSNTKPKKWSDSQSQRREEETTHRRLVSIRRISIHVSTRRSCLSCRIFFIRRRRNGWVDGSHHMRRLLCRRVLLS